MAKTNTQQSDLCPCCSARAYRECCGRYHAGEIAPSAEALMRSRYCAYVLNLSDYLRASWHPDTCPADLDLSKEAPRQWLGLEIRQTATTDTAHATVEFVARCKINGRAFRLHETSRFVQEQGRWLYRDGDLHE
jgi:SEC-C motif domain protein